MRILMICPQFRPLTGGYERAAERLSAALAARGHAVTVITERRDQSWPRLEEFSGFRIRRLRCAYRRGLHVATSLGSFAFWLLRHGRAFRVWHVHQYGAHATLAVLLGAVLRRPVVLKLANSGPQGLAATLATAWLPRLQRWAHRRVDACVALTVETREEVVEFGIPVDRVHEIGNAVDTDTFTTASSAERGALRARLGLPRGSVVVCVARLAEEKNPLGLIDACALARHRLAAPWAVVLVGDGPLRSDIEKRVRALQLQDCIILVGEQSNVSDWLRAADAFVLASHNEGMANTVLEALACGLPCVVTAVSGMQQLVGEPVSGQIVPVGDPEALANALVDIESNPTKRTAMGQRGREMVIARYSIPIIVERYIALYRQLAERQVIE